MGILGVIALLVILLAAKLVQPQIVYLAIAAAFAYPILKAVSPMILAALQKRQQQDSLGVIKHYKQAIREILEEHREFGYPSSYQPSVAAYLPALDYVVFELNRADLIKKGFSYSQVKAVDFEGTIVYDATTRKIFDVYQGWTYPQTLEHLRKYEVYFARNPQKTILLPLKTTETQFGLP